MSGGHFDYIQCSLDIVIGCIEAEIDNNQHFTAKTIKKFKEGLKAVQLARIYIHRMDLLLSADDGEDSFHRRLKSDLEKV
jgi:hypothetical protein